MSGELEWELPPWTYSHKQPFRIWRSDHPTLVRVEVASETDCTESIILDMKDLDDLVERLLKARVWMKMVMSRSGLSGER